MDSWRGNHRNCTGAPAPVRRWSTSLAGVSTSTYPIVASPKVLPASHELSTATSAGSDRQLRRIWRVAMRGSAANWR